MLLFTPWSAATADDVPDYLRACATEADDTRRLACFDSALGRADAERGRKKDPADGPIRAAVTKVSERKDGTLVITLDNGQTWAQKTAEYLPVKVGDQVTIKPGALSAVYLVTESRRSTQVKRVR